MTSDRLAEITAITLLAVAITTGLAIWVTRLRRRRYLRRTTELVAPLRPALIRIAADDDEDGAARAALAAVDEPAWKAVLPRIVGLSRQVTGASATSMRSLLQQRGADRWALDQSRRRSPARRLRGTELLGLIGADTGFQRLTELLDDGDAAVRMQAARSLARTADPTAVEPLLNALSGRRRIPAIEIGFALIRLGTAAVPALAEATANHPSPMARAMAADVLGHIGDSRALSALLLALRATSPDDVRAAAARAIGFIGDPDGEPFLLELATDRGASRAARCAAIGALGAVDAQDAAVALGRLLGEADTRIGAAAGEALAALGAPGQAVLETASIGSQRAAHQARAALSVATLRASAAQRR